MLILSVSRKGTAAVSRGPNLHARFEAGDKMAKKGSAEPSNIKIIAVNKKARFNYNLLERFEAGIVLSGAEIKSIRAGHISLVESYVRPHDGELFLLNANITEYSHSSDSNYEPQRKRKLLMHKQEIKKLTGRVEAQGCTIVPVKLYLKKGRAKLEIALAKGKAGPDKRHAIKDRELKVEAERAMKYSKR